MEAPFGGGAPIQWRGEGADHFYPTMSDIYYYIMSKRGGNGLRAVIDRKSPFWKWSAPSEVDNGNGLRPEIDREINGLRPQASTLEMVCALK